jgi:hypothetical protein
MEYLTPWLNLKRSGGSALSCGLSSLFRFVITSPPRRTGDLLFLAACHPSYGLSSRGVAEGSAFSSRRDHAPPPSFACPASRSGGSALSFGLSSRGVAGGSALTAHCENTATRHAPSPLPRLRRAPVFRATCGEGDTMIAQREAQRNAGSAGYKNPSPFRGGTAKWSSFAHLCYGRARSRRSRIGMDGA